MSEWIDVTERLPEIDYSGPKYAWNRTVIVACSAGVMEMRYVSNAYAKTEKGRLARWEWNSKLAPWEPTHWMPFPDAPEVNQTK